MFSNKYKNGELIRTITQGLIAGGFVYVATVDIIPLMLQDTSIRTIFIETLAMMLGLCLVLYWSSPSA